MAKEKAIPTEFKGDPAMLYDFMNAYHRWTAAIRGVAYFAEKLNQPDEYRHAINALLHDAPDTYSRLQEYLETGKPHIVPKFRKNAEGLLDIVRNEQGGWETEEVTPDMIRRNAESWTTKHQAMFDKFWELKKAGTLPNDIWGREPS